MAFESSARCYDALCSGKDYQAAAATLRSKLLELSPSAVSLLDVGCGTGQHLLHLREHYVAEGLDLSAEMLDIARRRTPTVAYHQGNMVDFDLQRTFDIVTCLFGSIGYARNWSELVQALKTMARHLAPEGWLVVEPWVTPGQFEQNRLVADFANTPDLKVARMYKTRAEGALSIFDITYLVGSSSGIETFTEHQELGLFTHDQYMEAFRQAGLEPAHDPIGLFRYGLYAGRRPGA